MTKVAKILKDKNRSTKAVAAKKGASAAKKSSSGGGKSTAITIRTKKQGKEKMYGFREMHHHHILMMTEEQLHEAHPFVVSLVFNEVMKKKDFNEKNVPDEACIMGVRMDNRKTHRFVVGNEQGEILPRFLSAKWIAIESGKVYGNPLTIETSDEEKAKSESNWVVVCS